MITEDLKKITIKLTIVVGCVIVILSLVTSYRYESALPPFPDIKNIHNNDSLKLEIANYSAYEEIVKGKVNYLNDLLLVNFMHGLFNVLIASIITFVFGKTLLKTLETRWKK